MRPSDFVKQGWTQRAWARDQYGGLLTSAHDLEAVAWCAGGACSIADVGDVFWETLAVKVGGSVPEWNDAKGRTALEVIEALEDVEAEVYA